MYEFCYLLFMKKVSFLQMDQIHPPGFLATGKSSKMISVQNKRINKFFYIIIPFYLPFKRHYTSMKMTRGFKRILNSEQPFQNNKHKVIVYQEIQQSERRGVTLYRDSVGSRYEFNATKYFTEKEIM